MKRNIASALIPLAVLACTVTVSTLVASAANKASGKATVYSDSFNGKKTATGTTYKKNQVSVASRKFPLGSKVSIKNRKTGKTIIAKVTDRTGKKSPAIVDLSKSAANKLGVKGTAAVDAKVVSPK